MTLNQKQNNYLLSFTIISGLLMIFFFQNITLKNEILISNGISLSEYLNYFYLNSKPRFDYLNGLWLMFAGIMFFCIITLIELPLKFEILKQEIKRNYYKKKILR